VYFRPPKLQSDPHIGPQFQLYLQLGIQLANSTFCTFPIRSDFAMDLIRTLFGAISKATKPLQHSKLQPQLLVEQIPTTIQIISGSSTTFCHKSSFRVDSRSHNRLPTFRRGAGHTSKSIANKNKHMHIWRDRLAVEEIPVYFRPRVQIARRQLCQTVYQLSCLARRWARTYLLSNLHHNFV
jgi:hypothetical protein